MVAMVPDVIVHKFDTSISGSGGGKDKKASVIEVLENNPMTTANKGGIDALSMAILTAGKTCFGVANPLGS